MLPDWVVHILESMGAPGAIIFVLLATCSGLAAYIRSQQIHANKVYGYRLTERDTLNKAMTDSAAVLADLLKAQEERNDLTQEQADLIQKQSAAFELLKVTILAQYESIRDHNAVSSQAVTAMAEALRVVTSIVMENRVISQGHVQNVQYSIAQQGDELRKAIRECSEAQIKEMRTLLGNVTRIEHRRKKPS